MSVDSSPELVRLPRHAVRFPVELRIPRGFRAEDPATYPQVEGRIEYFHGKLWFMPPTGDLQQDVVPSVVFELMTWSAAHPGFVVASNEAGMILGGETRGADAAVWRTKDAGARTGGYRRTPPLLAVEVAGNDDEEDALREKAAWYLARGVRVVWLVLPVGRAVVVLTDAGEQRCSGATSLPAHEELPGLAPVAERLFAQLI